MYYQWLQDLEEKHDFAKSYTILGGAFHNPEAAKKMIEQDSPGISISEEELEESSQKLLDEISAELKHTKETKNSKHRRFRVIKEEKS